MRGSLYKKERGFYSFALTFKEAVTSPYPHPTSPLTVRAMAKTIEVLTLDFKVCVFLDTFGVSTVVLFG